MRAYKSPKQLGESNFVFCVLIHLFIKCRILCTFVYHSILKTFYSFIFAPVQFFMFCGSWCWLPLKQELLENVALKDLVLIFGITLMQLWFNFGANVAQVGSGLVSVRRRSGSSSV